MISIIMPVFNAAPFLEECLDSILAQSYTEWELMAVDDHSTDDSNEILKAYSLRDPRVQLIENTDKGIIPALKLGYGKSTGSHITRMDADDIMPPKKLETLLEGCIHGMITTGKVSYFRSDGLLGDGYHRYAAWLNQLIDHESHWAEVYTECVIPSPAWMMDRETFDSIGAFNSERYPEDYDLVFRAYAHGLKVVGHDAIVHHWRDHGSRASRNDPNYRDNHFLDMKLDYFLELDRDTSRPLVLWGAGKKGKSIAMKLKEDDIGFKWLSNNVKKQNVPIYGVHLKDPKIIQTMEPSQILVLISGKVFDHNPLDQHSYFRFSD